MLAGFRCVALGSFRLCLPNYLDLLEAKQIEKGLPPCKAPVYGA